METMGRAVRATKRLMGMHAVGGGGPGPPRILGPCNQFTILDLRLLALSFVEGTIGHTHTKTQTTHFQGERR